MEEQVSNNFQEAAPSGASIWKHAMTYGMYYAILSILISVIMYITGTINSQSAPYISIAILLIALVIIQLHYRKTMDGYITYGQSLSIAILSMFFAAIPVAVFTYFLYKYIDPGLIDQIKLAAEERLVEQGRLNQEQIDATLAITEKFQTPLIISLGQLINFPLMGLIVGVISSIFIKKVSPDKIFE